MLSLDWVEPYNSKVDPNQGFAPRIAALHDDVTSGASELLSAAIGILSDARLAGANMWPIADAVCEAQPSMASVWNAAAAALSSEPDRFDRFVQRVRRAPQAIERYAVAHFAEETHVRPGRRPTPGASQSVRIVTLSYSGTVLRALKAVHAIRPLAVCCTESRPVLEGRRLATALAAAGIPVTLFSDAAIAHALDDADAILVGADAIAPSWFLNKSGTRMLAAAAAQQGVPFYVVASRDKFVDRHLAARLTIRSGEPGELWRDPPAGVELRNPYFERTDLDLVTAVISDAGVLGSGMVPEVCEGYH